MTTKTDILIIGGGSIGLNCAYYLLKSGRKVTIVDSKEIAKGSSAGNAGHIVPSHIIPLAAPGIVPTAFKWMLDPKNSPFGMKVSLDPKYISWLLQFTLACNEANVQRAIPPLNSLGQLSAKNFAQMIAEEKFDCHYQEKGLLFLYKTEEAFKGGQHEAELMQKHGIPVDVLDKAALHEREPAARDEVSVACISQATHTSTLRCSSNCSRIVSARWVRKFLRIRQLLVLTLQMEISAP